MKNETVADREAKTGKPDSIRNPDGSNARSDQQVKTLKKRLGKMAPGLTLPNDMPTGIVVVWGEKLLPIADKDLEGAVALLNAAGYLPQ